MWADASQYFNYSLSLSQISHLNVVNALMQLRVGYAGLPNLYGIAHCDCNNTVCDSNGAYVQPPTLRGQDFLGLDQFEIMALKAFTHRSTIINVCEVINDIWIENSHLMLVNTPMNHALLEQWWLAAVQNPEMFCRSHSQDQAVWSIIVSQYRLPIIALQCPYKMKNISNVLEGLSSGAFTWIDRSVSRWPLHGGISHNTGSDTTRAGVRCAASADESSSCPVRGIC